ncbi:sensor histidine kinase [Niallia sp. 01092]|uniref:sensor histidine kinase n=1 Tax=unclassified Niallia TaxID=2837522 RepID=UPI003FD2D89E
MQSYYIKLLLLLLFMTGALYASYIHTVSFITLLFFFTCILGLYFLIPIVQKKTLIYILILILIQTISLVTDRAVFFYLVVIMLFILMESSQMLSVKTFRILLLSTVIIHFVISVVLFHFSISLYVCAATMVIILFVRLNENSHEYASIRETYESLLNEYRIQKRQAFKNEHTARIEERNMIVREMHDSVGHKLTALLMQIELLSIQEKNESFALLRNMASESLEETRKAVRILQAEEIQGISSVIHLVKKLESENAVHVHLTTKQGVLGMRISNRQNAILYRVIQEGLTNAMKYSSSKKVFITLGVSPIGHITIEIKNTYVHKYPIYEGFGLKNMKKRLEEIGGKLDVYQADNQFILQGNMPVEEIEE